MHVSQAIYSRHEPWNAGRTIGPKPPLKSKHIWALRTRLLIAGRVRDLAMFNLAIDSKLVPEVNYGTGSYRLEKDKVGTRYVAVAICTLVDPNSPEDLKQVHALRNSIKVEHASTGKFEIPDWDAVSQKKVRDALIALQSTLLDFRNAFGKKGEVDPIRHLFGTAAAWAAIPIKTPSI